MPLDVETPFGLVVLRAEDYDTVADLKEAIMEHSGADGHPADFRLLTPDGDVLYPDDNTSQLPSDTVHFELEGGP